MRRRLAAFLQAFAARRCVKERDRRIVALGLPGGAARSVRAVPQGPGLAAAGGGDVRQASPARLADGCHGFFGQGDGCQSRRLSCVRGGVGSGTAPSRPSGRGVARTAGALAGLRCETRQHLSRQPAAATAHVPLAPRPPVGPPRRGSAVDGQARLRGRYRCHGGRALARRPYVVWADGGRSSSRGPVAGRRPFGFGPLRACQIVAPCDHPRMPLGWRCGREPSSVPDLDATRPKSPREPPSLAVLARRPRQRLADLGHGDGLQLPRGLRGQPPPHRLGAAAQQPVPAAAGLEGHADAGRVEVPEQPAEPGPARVPGRARGS